MSELATSLQQQPSPDAALTHLLTPYAPNIRFPLSQSDTLIVARAIHVPASAIEPVPSVGHGLQLIG